MGKGRAGGTSQCPGQILICEAGIINAILPPMSASWEGGNLQTVKLYADVPLAFHF